MTFIEFIKEEKNGIYSVKGWENLRFTEEVYFGYISFFRSKL